MPDQNDQNCDTTIWLLVNDFTHRNTAMAVMMTLDNESQNQWMTSWSWLPLSSSLYDPSTCFLNIHFPLSSNDLLIKFGNGSSCILYVISGVLKMTKKQ